MTEEIVTDPETGGRKGSKPEDFSLIDQEFLAEMSRVLSHAVTSGKYEPYNWRRGYKWSLSFSALWRHVGWRFWKKRESIDQDSGLHHLAHAAVHCMFMYVFDTENLGTDDRTPIVGGEASVSFDAEKLPRFPPVYNHLCEVSGPHRHFNLGPNTSELGCDGRTLCLDGCGMGALGHFIDCPRVKKGY